MNDEVFSLRKRIDSQSEGMERLLRENADLQVRIDLLEAEKRQWQAEKSVQYSIIAQRLVEMNAQKEAQAQEIRQLRERLKGDDDRLAH